MTSLGPFSKAVRLWNTVKHLKPIQIYGRAWFRYYAPLPDLRGAPPVRKPTGLWVQPARREPSLVGPALFQLLGETNSLESVGWDGPSLPKLWRYNQHYFDDLNAMRAQSRNEWHRDLIRCWIVECPPAQGVPWEPYPTSLRIVNWLKWLHAGNKPVEGMFDSMAIQVRHLQKRLEWHLLGNHLFVNAKALVMAGLFFEGPAARRWLETGWRIFRTQIPEQILPDGGQFERSPMYHALALEDILDLVNATALYHDKVTDADAIRITERAEPMLGFLHAMSHPDGEVSFFNDSVTGVAPAPTELSEYAERLGFCVSRAPKNGVTNFKHSGFIRVVADDATLLADVGSVGPPYLPGHAHAETLSFELSIKNRRVFVNSGISHYAEGPDRLQQRGTAAHNTVTVNGKNSSEVWGSFRVAKRATVTSLLVDSDDVSAEKNTVTITACHDGFRRFPGVGDHLRKWTFEKRVRRITVSDSVPGSKSTVSYWHVAPSLLVTEGPQKNSVCIVGNNFSVIFSVHGGDLSVEPTCFHSRFGKSERNKTLVVRFRNECSTAQISWK